MTTIFLTINVVLTVGIQPILQINGRTQKKYLVENVVNKDIFLFANQNLKYYLVKKILICCKMKASPTKSTVLLSTAHLQKQHLR